ncbi:phage integrase SAM-like domain-containing protein [Pantoea ananatis]|uniref:phage integrase SAM-like domain-containing protein n=2 Tax=Pantoea ananas TaxID=553 RepID=UPI0015891089|nr:phage integrase SAM-like domain-containing protein [Pantoea ananatis]MBA4823823.1 phage integrase SAM-like domain-containing protein [Pantoea ananatis]QKV89732.1 phage integrase SAM-like domain-containing protein [Pantoea ananatis]
MKKIKKKDRRNAYLFLSPDGIWYTRVMIPLFMRGLFQGRTSYSKSSGTGDIIQARVFRDAMIAEFNLLREQVKPVTEKRIDSVLNEIKRLRKHVENSPDDFSFNIDACPSLRKLANIYLLQHESKRKLTTLSKLNKGVELFLEFLDRKDVKLSQVNRTMVTNFIDYASKERATQTVRHCVANLGMLFDYASARYHDAPQAHLNPFRNHKLDTTQSESYQPFTNAELKLLLGSLEGELNRHGFNRHLRVI